MTGALYTAYAHAHGHTLEQLQAEKPGVAEVVRWANAQRIEFRILHGATSPEFFDGRSTKDTPVLSETGFTAFTAWLAAKYPTVRG
jgi:hypothetical protein